MPFSVENVVDYNRQYVLGGGVTAFSIPCCGLEIRS